MLPLKRIAAVAAIFAVILSAVALLGQDPAKPAADEPMLDLRVFGHSEFFAGSNASIRVLAADFNTEKPVAGAALSVSLQNPKDNSVIPLANAPTDAKGTFDAAFRIPELPEGKYEMIVAGSSGSQKGEVRWGVTLKTAYSVYLTTDKPLYQPNQQVHIRALMLRKFDLKPLSGEKALVEVEDPKGNKVFKKQAELSNFGIAYATFTLADEVSLGSYTIRVQAGKAKAEKTVTVDRYVLPKFKVECKLDKQFYFPKNKVKATLAADYFFGKPVSGAKVEVSASTFDVGFREFAKWEGKTTESGGCEFELDLPDYFIGQPLMQGKGLVRLEIKVTDTADHAEKKTVTTTVSEGSLVIHAFPEGGRFQRGMDNGVFVVAAYPDGTPAAVNAKCDVRFLPAISKDEPAAASFTLKTGENGVGEGRFKAEAGKDGRTKVQIEVSASDDRGNSAKKTIDLSVEPEEDGLKIIPDKAIYKAGERMILSVFSTRQKGLIYIDVVKDRQTVLTRAIEIEGGRGTYSLDVTPDLFGLLDVHAYQVRKSLSIVRDARRVFVNRADDLNIAVALDKDTYLPAQKATLDFSVTDSSGKPAAAALGLYIVDEAVFALSELQPGLEKVFFLLEKEILKPQVQIRGVESDILLGAFPTDAPGVDSRQQAGRVLFSITPPPDRPPVALSSRKAEMIKQLGETAKKIWAAAGKRGATAKGWPAGDLSVLATEGFLNASDLKDPWGTQFERQGCTCDSCKKSYLNLHSAGPDGKMNTADDCWVNQNGEVNSGGDGDEKFGRVRLEDREGGPPRAGAPGGPVPTPTPAPMAKSGPATAGPGKPPSKNGGEGGGAPAVRVREFFPETLFVMPELLTDENGRARQQVDLADSITSWRLSAFASSVTGALGSMSRPLRVFQDFFVDIDFPVELTQNDRVSVPVAIYNYLDEPQTVKLEAEASDWFEFLGDTTVSVEMKPGEVKAAYFPIRASGLGQRKFTVRATGSKMSDAIRRAVEIVPDGKKFETVINGRLLEKVSHTVAIPAETIDDSYKILVKFYPGVVCQLLEGMDGLLKMPGG